MSQTDLPIGVYSTQEKNRKKNRRSEKQMGSYYGEVHVVWVAQTKQACIDRVHMKEKINKSYSTFQNFFQKKQNKKYTSCFSFVEISCICYMYIYSVLPPCTSNSSSSSSCRCFFYHFSLFLFARAPNSLQKNCTFLISFCFVDTTHPLQFIDTGGTCFLRGLRCTTCTGRVGEIETVATPDRFET